MDAGCRLNGSVLGWKGQGRAGKCFSGSQHCAVLHGSGANGCSAIWFGAKLWKGRCGLVTRNGLVGYCADLCGSIVEPPMI